MYPRLQHAGGSQQMLQDTWATPCPVHGATAMYGRRHPVRHVYDLPLFDTDFNGEMMPAQGNGNPTSPLYHELDGAKLDLGGGPTPSPPPRPDGPMELPANPNSDPFLKI